MEAFALYLLKSVIWLSGFALVYFLFLQNERFFMLKRFYLVSGILISIFFPIISVHYQVELSAPDVNPVDFTPAGNTILTAVQQLSTNKPFDYRYILLFLYLAGVLFFAFRLIWHIRSLYRTINKANINNQGPAKLIRTSEFSSSFSFFNYVFVNPSVSETEMEEIMNHELVHVRQKHWFDLLIIEMLRLLQWVNPFVWIYTGFIRLNHEYIADEAALQRTSDPAIYRAALLNQMFSSQVISLSNSFNYSLNKKRFDMMKKLITSPYRKMKVLLVLPVFAIVFYSFAKPEYHYTSTTDNALTVVQAPVIFVKEVKGTVVKEDGKPFEGVIIVVSGTSLGVVSETAGHFAIGNVPEEASLVFSFPGYKTQILKPVFGTDMNVKMLKDPDYKEQVITRGMSSWTSQAKPLILIDGVVSNNGLNEIDPNEIQTMSVLKDKSATAVFGEKGKDGVIEITTKKKASSTSENKPAEIAVIGYGNQQQAKPPRRQNPEDFPTFQGEKFTSFSNWVISQLKYPAEAVAKGIQGRVQVNYTVESDGTLSNIKFLYTPDPLLGDALVKAVQSSPKWEPTKNPAFAGPFTSTVSIKFELPDKILPNDVFVIVEKMPMFPGGDVELLKFILEHAQYPAEAKASNIQGRVILNFIVNLKGKVEDVSVLKGVHPLLDAEAVRVVGLLPDFIPGTQGGKPMNVYYQVPVTFKLQ
ncbi:MAG: TonB family protein [Bacteroidales bacterium]|nr:TonB family protein [Bacteroidales bacterium]